MGIWHSWITPFVLFFSIFNRNLALYEIHNVGFWYNLGFYLAVLTHCPFLGILIEK